MPELNGNGNDLPETAQSGSNWQEVGSTIVEWADTLLPHLKKNKGKDLPDTADTKQAEQTAADDSTKKIILYLLGAVVAVVLIIFILKRK